MFGGAAALLASVSHQLPFCTLRLFENVNADWSDVKLTAALLCCPRTWWRRWWCCSGPSSGPASRRWGQCPACSPTSWASTQGCWPPRAVCRRPPATWESRHRWVRQTGGHASTWAARWTDGRTDVGRTSDGCRTACQPASLPAYQPASLPAVIRFDYWLHDYRTRLWLRLRLRLWDCLKIQLWLWLREYLKIGLRLHSKLNRLQLITITIVIGLNQGLS